MSDLTTRMFINMMYKHLSLWNLDGRAPDAKFFMTKEEMEYDLMEEYCQPDSEMSWDDLLNEMEMIQSMFEEGETQ